MLNSTCLGDKPREVSLLRGVVAAVDILGQRAALRGLAHHLQVPEITIDIITIQVCFVVNAIVISFRVETQSVFTI